MASKEYYANWTVRKTNLLDHDEIAVQGLKDQWYDVTAIVTDDKMLRDKIKEWVCSSSYAQTSSIDHQQTGYDLPTIVPQESQGGTFHLGVSPRPYGLLVKRRETIGRFETFGPDGVLSLCKVHSSPVQPDETIFMVVKPSQTCWITGSQTLRMCL